MSYILFQAAVISIFSYMICYVVVAIMISYIRDFHGPKMLSPFPSDVSESVKFILTGNAPSKPIGVFMIISRISFYLSIILFVASFFP
jgi:hypothetical protein